VAHLHAAARHAPDNEAVHRELMRAQAAANDVDGVQHTLARLTSRLAAHGQQPARATRQLAEQLRNDAAPQ
jgi:DNA-binding SARP family transcriptional activator